MLAIAGGKGGCGKTTTALGIARALGRSRASPPLVADADVEMPDIHVVADVPPRPGLRAVARGESIDAVARGTRLSGVSAVPAGGIDIAALPDALERTRAWTGPTLVDCPAGAARDAAVPLRFADRTLLVTTPDERCIRDTIKTAAMARTLDAPTVGVVVVRRPGATAVAPAVVRSAFECPVLCRVPAGGNRPLTTEAVRSAYRRVTKKINERNI